MDSITIKGKLYEKSAIVAKRYGYTVDYLGQLARSGKIDSELVGRSRYVYAISVEEYQKQLSDSTADENTSSEKPTQTSSAKRSSKKATTSDPDSYSVPLHIIKDTSVHNQTKTKIKANHTVANYYSDEDTELIPTIKKVSTEEYHTSIPVQDTPSKGSGTISITSVPEEANTDTQTKVAVNKSVLPEKKVLIPEKKESNDSEKKVKIHSYSANFSIINPQLPKVRLKGKIKVGSGSDNTTRKSSKNEIRAIQNYIDKEDRDFSRDIDNYKQSSSKSASNTEKPYQKTTEKSTVSVATSSSAAFSYTPQSVKLSSSTSTEKSYLFVMFITLLLFLVAGMFFIESRTVFVGESGLTATTWHFSLPW